MIIYQRYSGICVSIIVFHTYIISYLVYVVKCFIHLLKIFYVSSAIHPTPKGVGFPHYFVKKDLNLTQLKDGIKVSSSTIAKIKKNEYISTRVIDDICNFLNCEIEDVIEHIKN